MIYDSILGTIGRTPIVRINRLAPQHVTMYVKCEFFNPISSVKDRLAIAIIEDAERRGTLSPGQTVVEATSGNTGIALAMVCAAKGYPFVAIIGGLLLNRASQNHAHARRAGHPDTGRGAWHRYDAQG
jgi:cysteine synthase